MSRRTVFLRAAMFAAAPILFVAACSSGAINSASSTGDPVGSDEQLRTGDSLDTKVGNSTPGSASVSGNAGATGQGAAFQPLVGRAVIATADITLRVKDVESSLSELKRLATSTGGYVAGEDTNTDPDNKTTTRSTLVLRIPTHALQGVIDDVDGYGDVIKSHQDVQDVTQQVVDVQSRVKSARASVARIRILLGQANTLGQVVRIEGQLSQREADLEALLAQQRALSDQTALATLTLSVLGPDTAVPSPVTHATGFLAGFSRGWNAFVSAVVVGLTAFGVLLPFALAGGLVLLPVGLYWRRRQSRPLAEPS